MQVRPIYPIFTDATWCIYSCCDLSQMSETLTSPKIPDAKLHLSLLRLITFIGKRRDQSRSGCLCQCQVSWLDTLFNLKQGAHGFYKHW